MANTIYVPGLATDRLVDADPAVAADDQVGLTGDEYITGAVSALKKEPFSGTVVAPGKAFNWVDVQKGANLAGPQGPRGISGEAAESRVMTKGPAKGMGKAFAMLGLAADNMLRRTLPTDEEVASKSTGVKAPKSTVYWEYSWGTAASTDTCFVTTQLAQPKASTVVGRRALANVGMLDTLFIVGHGNHRGGALVYKMPSSRRCADAACTKDHHKVLFHIDAVTLASQLQDEGLKTTHKVIQTVMCFGGGLRDEGEQTVQSFAQRLAGALGDRGYGAVKVGGSVGIVLSGGGKELKSRSGLQYHPDGRIISLQGQGTYKASVRWFGSDGAVLEDAIVASPVVPVDEKAAANWQAAQSKKS